MAESLKSQLNDQARDAGFDVVRITKPDTVAAAAEAFDDFLDRGWHGTMDWLAANAARRRDPRALWPDVKSVVMLGMNYGPESDPLKALTRRDRGHISVYAQGADYHDVIKKKLKRVAGWLHREAGAEVKVFVDTAPVMEKPLAAAAGLGWQGKHTNLVSRDLGSWLFLGSIFTAAELEPDAPIDSHCGRCRKCLDICPTNAFPAPYRLDARRCISYLTIEHKGHIDREFRAAMGNRIYGCDDCLAVCPWNKFAKAASEARFAPRSGRDRLTLAELLRLDDAAFRALFTGSPVKRTGRDRFMRNVLIASGNSGDASLLPAVEALLDDKSAIVRAMAVWAISRLADETHFRRIRGRHLPREFDPVVRSEWRAPVTESPRLLNSAAATTLCGESVID